VSHLMRITNHKWLIKSIKSPGTTTKWLIYVTKLIGVFMVDKPTPTDRRKLIAFSREWDNIMSFATVCIINVSRLFV
jgi:hypothetical protein